MKNFKNHYNRSKNLDHFSYKLSKSDTSLMENNTKIIVQSGKKTSESPVK